MVGKNAVIRTVQWNKRCAWSYWHYS